MSEYESVYAKDRPTTPMGPVERGWNYFQAVVVGACSLGGSGRTADEMMDAAKHCWRQASTGYRWDRID